MACQEQTLNLQFFFGQEQTAMLTHSLSPWRQLYFHTEQRRKQPGRGVAHDNFQLSLVGRSAHWSDLVRGCVSHAFART